MRRGGEEKRRSSERIGRTSGAVVVGGESKIKDTKKEMRELDVMNETGDGEQMVNANTYKMKGLSPRQWLC